MKVIVKGKEYEVKKITRTKNKIFNDAFDKVKNKAEEDQEFNENDLDLMVETLVKLYDNEFTEEDINEDMEVSDIIFNFMGVQIDIQTKLNKKLNGAKKNFTQGK
jgi:uncharacterized protein YpuA (DUF1002 family)